MYSDNQALQFITRPKKLKQRHAKWIEFMKNSTLFIKHISRNVDKVVDALSRRILILQEFQVKTLGFDHLKEMYHNDLDFGEAYEVCVNPMLRDRSQWAEYLIQDGFLFKGCQLCIPKCSMRENFLKEKHSVGLAGHFDHEMFFHVRSVRLYLRYSFPLENSPSSSILVCTTGIH